MTVRKFATGVASALALATLAITGAAAQTAVEAKPAAHDAKRARTAMFRAFAEPYIGTWTCAIEEFDRSGKVVWSDTQRRIFAFSMSRHFLEERAILKRPDGSEYEGGLHLTTYDPKSDRIVQHGFWLPRQPDPIFRIEGVSQGRNFIGEMSLKTESGAVEKKRLSMRWIDDRRWVLEAIDTAPDGTTFVRERLTYTRV